MQATEAALTGAVRQGRVPGAVAAVSSAAGCHYLRAFGAASTDPPSAMRVDAVFRIASMTKLVTSVATLMLADDGLVDLDQPLARYVPGFEPPDVLHEFVSASDTWMTRPARRAATLRELLSHTGGYGYWWLHEPLRIASGPEPDLIHPPFLIGDPGEQFAYSTSTDVIGLLFEPVTGQTLDEFFAARIFAPLGMTDTSFSKPDDRSRLVPVHRRSGDTFHQLPIETGDPEIRGGGGLYSTAADYSRLLRMLLRGGELDGTRLLSEAAVAALGSNQIGELEARMQRTAFAERSNDFIFMDGSQKFGFGVMVETRAVAGKRTIGSYGWGGIVNTFFWVDPARDLAAVLMLQMAPFANRACVELLDAFERAVYRDMTGERSV